MYPGPIRKDFPRVGSVEENTEVPPEQPPIEGWNVVRVEEGREDNMAGEPRVLYVEIKDGTTSLPGGEWWRAETIVRILNWTL